MARKPQSFAIGYLDAVKDKSGKQVVHPEKGLKWKARAELPRRGAERRRARKYRTLYGSKRKAIIEMNKFVAEINHGFSMGTISSKINVDVSSLTFGRALEDWLQINRDNGRLCRITWEKYMGKATNHIIPYLGHILLHEMSQYHIARYKEIKLGEGQKHGGGRLSPETVNKHLALISNVLNDAAEEKGLILFNPAKSISRARCTDSGKGAVENCLTAVELGKLLSELEILYSFRRRSKSFKENQETIRTLKRLGFSEKELASPKALHKFKVVKLYPVVYLAAVTGMRLSELLALKWENIDFLEAKIIKVYEGSHYGTRLDEEKSAHHINPTKEKRVKPYIDLSPEDVIFLKRYRQEQLKERLRYQGSYTNNNLVFSQNNGSYLRNDTVSKQFSSFTRSIKMAVTFHGLRHTHITLLLGSGVPSMFVARRVGHQKESTTTDYYGHANKAEGPNLAVIFHAVLAQAKRLKTPEKERPVDGN